MSTGLEDLIDVAARQLQANMRTGYTEGYEFELAEEAVESIGPNHRDNVLDLLAQSRMMDLVLSECLLPEDDDETYKIVNDLAGILAKAIRHQILVGADTLDASLRRMFVVEICRMKDVLDAADRRGVAV